MPLTRRNFLIRGSLSLAAGALSSVLVEAKTRENAPADLFALFEFAQTEMTYPPACSSTSRAFSSVSMVRIATRPSPVRWSRLSSIC